MYINVDEIQLCSNLVVFLMALGIYLGGIWHSNGIQMAFKWHSNGVQMAFKWRSNGVQMAFKWRSTV